MNKGDNVYIPHWEYTVSKDIHAKKEQRFGIYTSMKPAKGVILDTERTKSVVVELSNKEIVSVKPEWVCGRKKECMGLIEDLKWGGNDYHEVLIDS